MKRDNAFNGLEAAIVLIAFVVVAAVFSYVLIGAGFFATQKAQEITYAGIQQATSNLFLVGQMYGDASNNPAGSNSDNILRSLNLKLEVPEGGLAQNLSQLQLLFSNEKGLPTELTYGRSSPGSAGWEVIAINGEPPAGNYNIFPGDKAEIKISNIEHFQVTSRNLPNSSRSFTLEIKPRIGASYLIARTLAVGYVNGPLY